MSTRSILIKVAAMAALAAFTGSVCAFQSQFDFPAQQAELLDAMKRHDVVRLRRHAWNVFSYVTGLDSGTQQPLFMTWMTKANMFPKSGTQTGLNTGFGFEIPVQSRKFASDQEFQHFLETGQGGLPASTVPILAKVYYNDDLYRFACTPQKTLNGGSLNQTQSFTYLNTLFDGQHTWTKDRNIPDFPNKSLAIKTAWWIASADQLTLLPVWDRESNSPQPGGNGLGPLDGGGGNANAGAWARHVAIDASPAGSGKKTVELPIDSSEPDAYKVAHVRVVPLRHFFYLKIETQDQLKEIKDLSPEGGGTVKIGDYAVLVGLHLTTKEIPNWVWATFWWHDQPDQGPFAAQRPDIILNPWRNYLMSVAYSMTEPKESDGSPHIAFNPYLEAATGFRNGAVSNCMSCHRLARFPNSGEPVEAPVGNVSPSDVIFRGAVKVDFLWSLATGSQSGACDPMPQ